jgi:hypothetical protein
MQLTKYQGNAPLLKRWFSSLSSKIWGAPVPKQSDTKGGPTVIVVDPLVEAKAERIRNARYVKIKTKRVSTADASAGVQGNTGTLSIGGQVGGQQLLEEEYIFEDFKKDSK